jgi:hypothetical protein
LRRLGEGDWRAAPTGDAVLEQAQAVVQDHVFKLHHAPVPTHGALCEPSCGRKGESGFHEKKKKGWTTIDMDIHTHIRTDVDRYLTFLLPPLLWPCFPFYLSLSLSLFCSQVYERQPVGDFLECSITAIFLLLAKILSLVGFRQFTPNHF